MSDERVNQLQGESSSLYLRRLLDAHAQGAAPQFQSAESARAYLSRALRGNVQSAQTAQPAPSSASESRPSDAGSALSGMSFGDKVAVALYRMRRGDNPVAEEAK